MRARAPGKLVLSGAYAVLHGAPAIVAAVDRYVLADAGRPAELVTDEVRAAIGAERAPWFDATALRGDGRKLGLGSSAAIVVASLAALELAREGDSLPDDVLASRVLQPALEAHRSAQGGGSGVDVVASTLGGHHVVRRHLDELQPQRCRWPKALRVEAWVSSAAASTPELLARVRQLAQAAPARFAEAMTRQSAAAEAAAAALDAGDALGLVSALSSQHEALRALGEAASAPIVTPEAGELHELAQASAAVVLPAGAGGGDVVLFFGPDPSTAAFAERATRLGHARLELTLGARGVHALARADESA
ncbi:MAG: hypothetical protein KF718_23175 [Polyangiaceae bacterium]|nr:hypothetical protein [Polyangiaceae bacterium]